MNALALAADSEMQNNSQDILSKNVRKKIWTTEKKIQTEKNSKT